MNERKHMDSGMESYKREIQSALYERDQAQKQLRELEERVGQITADNDSSIDPGVWSRLHQISRPNRCVLQKNTSNQTT